MWPLGPLIITWEAQNLRTKWKFKILTWSVLHPTSHVSDHYRDLPNNSLAGAPCHPTIHCLLEDFPNMTLLPPGLFLGSLFHFGLLPTWTKLGDTSQRLPATPRGAKGCKALMGKWCHQESQCSSRQLAQVPGRNRSPQWYIWVVLHFT